MGTSAIFPDRIDAAFLDAAASDGLVVVAGAGISMLAPTGLPSWWDFNEAVLGALARHLAQASNAQFSEERLRRILERRERQRSFTPDFMAQLMEEEAGARYFEILTALDSDRCNENHAALAELAGAGVVRAIVTTNFDRLIERALTARGVPFDVYFTTGDFERLPAALEEPGDCLVIKVHGSVEAVDSMVDTLAQRVAGRPEVLERSIAALLERHACLSLGFSGADLAYDGDYLGLRSAAERGKPLRVITIDDAPLPAMAALVAAFGDRGGFIRRTLPDALRELCAALGVPHAPAPAPPAPDMRPELHRRAEDWAGALGTVTVMNMFLSLVDAYEYDATLLRFLMFFHRYYRTGEQARAPTYWRFEYAFGRRLLDEGLLGQFDAREARLTVDGIRDINAKDFTSAAQFLGRAEHQNGALTDPQAALEARIQLTWFWILFEGPGRAVGNVNAMLAEVADRPDDRIKADALLVAAQCAELLGRFEQSTAFAMVAAHCAAAVGDDVRRARIQAQGVRTLAFGHQFDDARALAADTLAIGRRLELPVITADGLAAIGLVEVFQSETAAGCEPALAPLREACAVYARMRRRPRLVLALCDLVRATYYAGGADEFADASEQLDALASRFPGLEPLADLTTAELLASAAGGPEVDAALASKLDALRKHALATGNEWAASRADRIAERR